MKKRVLNGCLLLLLSALVLIISLTAAAHPQGDFMSDFDTNEDGVVSLEEFNGLDDHFDALDADGDGSISSDEAPQGPPPGNREDIDTDGDGLISEDEFPGPSEHFDELDADDNGYIDADEKPAGPPGRGPLGGKR